MSCPIAQCCSPYSSDANAYRVVQIGDFGGDGPGRDEVLAMVKAANADVVVTSGDNSYESTFAAGAGVYSDFNVQPPQPGGFLPKLRPVMGNHDWDIGLAPYTNYFGVPAYYTFKLGGVAQFFMLDSGFNTSGQSMDPDGNTPGTLDGACGTIPQPVGGSVQWNWFVAQIRASTSAWKIAVLHHPPYSSGTGHAGQINTAANSSYPSARWFDGLPVDLVISGHEHSYERLVVGEITYIVNGLGGRSIYGFGTPIDGSIIRYNDDSGALFLEISSTKLLTYFVDISGQRIDINPKEK